MCFACAATVASFFLAWVSLSCLFPRFNNHTFDIKHTGCNCNHGYNLCSTSYTRLRMQQYCENYRNLQLQPCPEMESVEPVVVKRFLCNCSQGEALCIHLLLV